MKNALITLLIVLTSPMCGYAQIGAKTQQNKIYGTWQNNSSGFQMTLILNANGRGEFDGDEISFTLQGNKLSVSADGETTIYNYVLQNNSLTLSGGDIDGQLIFTRSGSKMETAPVNNSENAPVNSIVGVWSGSNEKIKFTQAGQCIYIGQTYPYQAANGKITLQTVQGNIVMAYVITGNQLSLTINGQTINYSKEGTSGTQTAGTETGKHIAQELVGKWCYVNVNSYNSGGSSTDQCIILNANGTYEYYSETSRSVNTNTYSGGTNSQSSDRGTWTYDGTRIHYASSMGAGSGSYVLEKRNHPKNNDPMIVLDGKTYVTQYQKSPWR